MTPSQRTHLFSDVCKRKPTLHLKPMAPENRMNDDLQFILKLLVGLLLVIVIYAACIVGFSIPDMEIVNV